ncbi:MAG: SDR family NAD(P)-dependent oxidoreductase [Pseudomonadales bacterium]|jgi:NAD(P)-dependent dehydrogenase (short-subunit alcohol dehydrogenase family)|nr:SDR family NAD(P)-dependent oxidoreductase [Pseudomonadales bacterium]MCP5333932.1 SDR family NAD(P)-dependent oxidoreductase [Pseudomonadales bacterium]HMU89605.1 SDR family NAD(P)-dependent oxidoreductase [Pseudomonadales bacterium]HMW15135.1 SDR family NAD(P)-dependent oxidoreductase [Pseudomonadales bacterium]HMW82570.1 SDR family NAD(P)-dependent oxidoreductase [Pseudomonadales bacterium]
MTISFEGKVAIVTGAGNGLGRQHALELARRGAKVVVNDLGGAVDGSGGSSKAAEAVVAEIRAFGGTAIANGGSVSDKAGAKSMVDDAVKHFGTVHILINNAGILRDKSFSNMTFDDFEAVINVHLLGAVYVTKYCWEIMKEQKYGRILMTTSGSGLFGNFGQTNYSAAKLGMVGFMNTLRLEGAKHNVYTNSLAPAALTRMTENLLPGEVAQGLAPELVTPGALFMVSDQAPNGVIIQAQGGSFGVAAILQNDKVSLGDHPTVEDVAANWERISDLSKVGTRTEKLVSQPPKK